MSSLTGPTQTAGQGLYTSSATQYHTLGEQMVTPDGRKFRYAKAGAAALVRGNLLQSQAEDTDSQNLAVAAAAIGATSITTTTTLTATANEFSGGYMLVAITPGLGQMYRIKSNPAVTTAVMTFTLEDALTVALTTDSRIDLIANLYDGVIQNPTTATGAVVGVAVHPIAIDEYGWIQTGGPACVLNDAGSTVGTNVSASNATAGAVEAAVTAQAAVGYAITGITTTEAGAIFLTID